MKKGKRTKTIVPDEIRCSYCQGTAVIRPAEEIIGETGKGKELYVCSNYPVCDAYVQIHEYKPGHLPMGTLANAKLREKRAEVHRYLDAIWKEKFMSRRRVYGWLGYEMLLPPKRTHVSEFDIVQCNYAIQKCRAKLEELRKYAA